MSHAQDGFVNKFIGVHAWEISIDQFNHFLLVRKEPALRYRPLRSDESVGFFRRKIWADLLADLGRTSG